MSLAIGGDVLSRDIDSVKWSIESVYREVYEYCEQYKRFVNMFVTNMKILEDMD